MGSRLGAAGALLQLAVTRGVKLDVARDDLARVDCHPAAVSRLFPPASPEETRAPSVVLLHLIAGL